MAFPTAVREAVPQRQSRRPAAAILSIAGAIGLVFFVTYGLPYFTRANQEPSLSEDRRGWLLVHIVSGAVALFAGPIQLWLGLSDRRMEVHRRLGILYMASVAVGSAAAYIVLALRPGGRPAYVLGLVGLATAWILTTGMAYLAIRRGMIEQHKEWMIRSYVVTFGFVVFRMILPVMQVAGIAAERGTTAAWACWAVPLLITELILQGRKILVR